MTGEPADVDVRELDALVELQAAFTQAREHLGIEHAERLVEHFTATVSMAVARYVVAKNRESERN